MIMVFLYVVGSAGTSPVPPPFKRERRLTGTWNRGADTSIQRPNVIGHHLPAVAWQQDLRAVKEVMESEINRLCDGEPVSCIQLHIAGGESLGVQYIDYSCVYVIQVCCSPLCSPFVCSASPPF
jgi:hypothetical protein